MENKKLKELSFIPLSLGMIQPIGWILKQLQIQANGLSGYLDEFWPPIKNSKWLGGETKHKSDDICDETVPYWLDGLVPLAYLLRNKSLINKVEKAMDYIIEHQQKDGWLGPGVNKTNNITGIFITNFDNRDIWPVFPLFKAMIQYYEVSNDERVINTMKKWCKKLDEYIDWNSLRSFNKFRWQDLLISLFWLFEKTGDDWILNLARRVDLHGYKWLKYFLNFPYKEKYVDQKKFCSGWALDRHVVNHAMAIKVPGIIHRLYPSLVNNDFAKNLIMTLDKYHGQATGIFSGDECLAGRMPSQGTELCAVVEYMYSLEVLIYIFGDPFYGDRLEKIAYNALPATFSPDMWTHQYIQQANQVICCETGDIRNPDNRVYTTNSPRANLFGLEPNFLCCTANMHQGWPKFITHSWMKTHDGGYAAVALAPTRVEDKIGNTNVKIELITDYPFCEELNFIVTTDQPIEFPFTFRVPKWAYKPTVEIDGKITNLNSGSYHSIKRLWSDTTQIKVKLPMNIITERRYNNSISLSRGPLIYSLKIEEEWKKILPLKEKINDEVSKKYLDSEIYPLTDWNYALDIDDKDLAKSIELKIKKINDMPFSPDGAPIEIKVKGRKIPEWKIDKNAAAAPPKSPISSNEPLDELTLIPYGSSNLRVTEFPVLRKS